MDAEESRFVACDTVERLEKLGAWVRKRNSGSTSCPPWEAINLTAMVFRHLAPHPSAFGKPPDSEGGMRPCVLTTYVLTTLALVVRTLNAQDSEDSRAALEHLRALLLQWAEHLDGRPAASLRPSLIG